MAGFWDQIYGGLSPTAAAGNIAPGSLFMPAVGAGLGLAGTIASGIIGDKAGKKARRAAEERERKMMALAKKRGEVSKQRISRGATQSRGNLNQSLASRGLLNTTVTDTLGNDITETEMRNLADVDESVTNAQLGVMGQFQPTFDSGGFAQSLAGLASGLGTTFGALSRTTQNAAGQATVSPQVPGNALYEATKGPSGSPIEVPGGGRSITGAEYQFSPTGPGAAGRFTDGFRPHSGPLSPDSEQLQEFGGFVGGMMGGGGGPRGRLGFGGAGGGNWGWGGGGGGMGRSRQDDDMPFVGFSTL